MAGHLNENVTLLIEKPLENKFEEMRKKRKRPNKKKPLDEQKIFANHRKKFHTKTAYNKPWVLSNQRKVKKVNAYEQKCLLDIKEPILLPKDPVTLGRLNFGNDYIKKIKTMQPRVIRQRYIDSRFGDSHDLISSGLYPIYVNRKNKLPNFLKKKPESDKSKTAIQAEEKMNNIQKDVKPKGLKNCRKISDNEKSELLLSMKKRWDQFMSEFQTLPFIICMQSQIIRKVKLEKALKQLEKDIDIIERHKYLYVKEDPEKK